MLKKIGNILFNVCAAYLSAHVPELDCTTVQKKLEVNNLLRTFTLGSIRNCTYIHLKKMQLLLQVDISERLACQKVFMLLPFCID